jgi:hypothetical protein
MASTLKAPRPPAPRGEEFVEQRIREARGRVRWLDIFSAGLTVFVATMFFVVAVLLVDRYVETPPGLGWAAVAGWALVAGGYLWWTLLRPSRRSINPYYAARQVEQTIPGAKNSVINYVDLQDDTHVPESIRHAVAIRAAKDLKQVDLNRAIERKQVLWLAAAAGVAFVAALIVTLLPPTRTQITLLDPKGGDTIVFSGQDAHFQVRLDGRIPSPGEPEAARLRIWYNPADPDTFEDRPLEVAPQDRHAWGLTLPARQVRAGFLYQVLAGNAATKQYTVTYKIIPAFERYEVKYEYPDYLNRKPATESDPNLVGNYGTRVTLTAVTNREVQGGTIEVDGQAKTIEGEVPKGEPQSVRFTFPLERSSTYRIWFTTVEGEKNSDPPRFRMAVLDPKPGFVRFNVGYDYPAYLRWKKQTVKGVVNPQIEAMRGTKVALEALTNRPIKDATLSVFSKGQEAVIPAEKVKDKPNLVRFALSPLMQDGKAVIRFTPTTPENVSEPKEIPIRVLSDEKPKAFITNTDPTPVKQDEPKAGPEVPEGKEDEVTPEVRIPANGTLGVEGFATDDHGVVGMTLRMEVVEPAAARQFLKEKPYRPGKSFLREKDQSYPTRLEYKDVVELPKLKRETGEPFAVAEGMAIEFWLEAKDNCAVPPGPNYGISKRWRLRIQPPEKNPDKQKQQQQKNDQLNKEQQQHNNQQDRKNDQENRDPNQPPPQGGDKENQPPKDGNPDQKDNPEQKNGGNEGQPKKNDETKHDQNPQGGKKNDETKHDQNPQGGNKSDQGNPKDANPKEGDGKENQGNKRDQDIQNQADDINQKLNQQHEQDKASDKPNNQPQNGQRENPAESKPNNGGMGQQQNPADAKPQPKNTEDGNAGGDNKPQGKLEQKPDKSESKGSGNNQPGKNDAARDKPDPVGGGVDKGDNKPKESEGAKPEPKNGNEGAAEPKEKEPGKGKGDGNQRKPDAGQAPKTPENANEPKPKEDGQGNDQKVAAGNNKPEPKNDRGSAKQATGEPNGPKPKATETAANKPEKSENPADAKAEQSQANSNPNEKPASGKPSGNQNTTNAPPAAEDKSQGGGKKGENVAQGENKPDPNQQLQPGGTASGEKLDPEAMKKLAQDLKNADPKSKQDALNQLDKMASDPAAREAAQKKFEELLKNSSEQEKKDIADALKQLAEATKQANNGGKPKEGPKPSDVANNPPAATKPEPKGKGEQSIAKQPGKKSDEPPSEPKKGEGAKSDVAKTDTAQSKPGPATQKKEDQSNGPKKEGTQVAKNDQQAPKNEGKGDTPNKSDGSKEGPKKNGPDGKGEVAKNEPNGPKKDGQDGPPSKDQAKGEPKKGKDDPFGGKRDGQAQGVPSANPEEADLKNRLKAGELQLERFKRDRDSVQKIKGWGDKEYEEFLRDMEESLKRQRAELEKKGPGDNARTGNSVLNTQPEKITPMPSTLKADPLQGGRYTPPPGFADPYEQFTKELAGVRKKE